MTRFALQVVQTIRRFALVAPGDRVLVALSGGPDSMALLSVLGDVLPRFEAALVGVAHVHHGLRGAAADADLASCERHAASLDLPFTSRRVDVPGEAARRGWSVERTAHALRHAALRRAAADLGATTIALGHTRDDQAETVILRFLRGAGTRGMGGMHPRRGRCIRPLLETSRTAVELFLSERGLTYQDDSSNRDLSIPRNRVRHEVLPSLIELAGSGLPARLARQAEVWRDEDGWLEQAAAPWVAQAVEASGDDWLLHLDRLRGTSNALRRRVYWALARLLLGERTSSRTVELIARFETLREGRQAAIRGWLVDRNGAVVRFTPRGHGPSTSSPTSTAVDEAAVALTVPGEAMLEATGVRVTAELIRRDDVVQSPNALGPHAAMVDADEVGSDLVVRPWQFGDRVRPIGLGGSQKLQDLFINRKVPRGQRSRVPVVSTPDGQIVWVVGLAVDRGAAVKASTRRVIILKATHPGGKA